MTDVGHEKWSRQFVLRTILEVAEEKSFPEREYDRYHDARNFNALVVYEVLRLRPLPVNILVLQPEDNYVALILKELGFRTTLAAEKVYSKADGNLKVANPTARIFTAGHPYDLVLALGSMEYLAQFPKVFLDGVRGILKPGGTLLLTGQNVARSVLRVKVLLGKSPYPPIDGKAQSPDRRRLFSQHVQREYTLHEMTSLIMQSGFELLAHGYGVGGVPYEMVPMSLSHFLCRVANYYMMKGVPSLRDTFVVMARKP